MRGASSAWASSRPGREACPCSLADGERVQVHALDASPPDGREPPLTVVCVHGNPTWSLHVALVPPAARRPLPRARRRPGVDGALASAPARGRTRSGSTTSAASSTPSRSTARSSSRPTTGAGRSRSAGRSSTRSRCSGSCSPTRASRCRRAGVPLPIRFARHELLRDLACRRTSAFLRTTLATAHGRIGEGGEERVSRAVRVGRRPAGDRGLRGRHPDDSCPSVVRAAGCRRRPRCPS